MGTNSYRSLQALEAPLATWRGGNLAKPLDKLMLIVARFWACFVQPRSVAGIWGPVDRSSGGDPEHASSAAAGPDPGGDRAVRRRPHRPASGAARGVGHDGPPRHRR